MSQVKNDIPEGWITTTLGEVTSVQSGGTPSTKNENYWGNYISWITPRDLSGYEHVFIEKGERSISELGLKNSSAKLLPKHTILFSSRAPIGYVVIANNEITTNQGFKNIICDEEKSHYKYFYYLMKYKSALIESLSSGSTFSEASASLIKSIEVAIPKNINEQKAIAKVLTAFDDKIENLRAQNDTLEQTAQTIFTEWFGKYQIGDELPEGWRVGKLSNLLKIKYGKDHKHLNDGDFPLYGSGGIMRYVEKPLYDKESILIPRKGTLSNLFYLNQPFWSVDTMFYSEIKHTIQGRYTYLFLKSLDLAAMNVGSAVPSLTTNVLNQIPIIIPENKIMTQFNNAIGSFYTKINFNLSQIQSLSQTRDTLLPKLMSGQLRVKNIETLELAEK